MCISGNWVDMKCPSSEICLEDACVLLTEECTENTTRCLSSRYVEVCTEFSKARAEACGEGFVCDAAACASGGECCVPVEVCQQSANQCLDTKTVEVCIASEEAKIKSCGEGFVCDAAACASGGQCCVDANVCQQTATRCLDSETVEVCKIAEKPKAEVCGEGLVCNTKACANGENCCVDKDICQETAKQCLDAKTVEVCVKSSKATHETCDADLVCDAVACESGGECCVVGKLCSETAKQCLDTKTIEICKASENATYETCGDGFVCDAAACAMGGNCCVAGKICLETANRCLDAKIVEICTKSSKAKYDMCSDGLICDDTACVNGGNCCVVGKICSETAKQCVDIRTAEICVEGNKAETEPCGDGFFCDAKACASGKDCCVIGEICKETKNTCIDADKLKVCVEGQRPREQSCGAGGKCTSNACVGGACNNNRLDIGEEAVDCGGGCAPCVECRSDVDCGVGGFCDSAFGHVCSKRCRSNADCQNSSLWDGEYCREDARCSPKVFETVWQLSANSLMLVLPYDSKYPSAKCDFQILWGDEPAGTDITKLPRVTDCASVKNRTHIYPAAGKYNVKIIGTYDGWGDLSNAGTYDEQVASKLRSVISFGPVGLGEKAFSGAKEFRVVPKRDIPHALKLKSLAYTFAYVAAFNAPIGHWDTSQVKSMSHMFSEHTLFNQPIGDWDTSQVTDMSAMFSNCQAFNQDLSAWNTSKVTNMHDMFLRAFAFNQPVAKWNVSSVTDMGYMFSQNSAFNQPIDSWNTSSVTNMDNMFSWASSFNQAIGSWDVSEVTTMRQMFHYASKFNQDLSHWTLVDVILQEIFKTSAMDTDHLCALKAKGGEWSLKWAELGKTAVCE